MARNEEAQVRELLGEIDSLTPRRAAVELALGDALGAVGRNEEAMLRYRSAAALDAALPQPYLGLARQQLAARDSDSARASLEKALALQPGWRPAAEGLARLEASQGRLDAALKIAADLKRRTPDDAAPWALEGDLLAGAGRTADAVRSFEAAYQREPSGMVATRLLGVRRVAGVPEPERTLVQWLAQSPGDVRGRRTLASYYLSAGKYGLARAEYEKVVVAAPDDAMSLNNLAWIYGEAKDSRAIEMARKAFELAPQSGSVADTYGWLLVQSGDLQQGLQIMRQAAEKSKDSLAIHYHLAYALNADGKTAEARDVLRHALGGSRADDPARALAEELQRELDGP